MLEGLLGSLAPLLQQMGPALMAGGLASGKLGVTAAGLIPMLLQQFGKGNQQDMALKGGMGAPSAFPDVSGGNTFKDMFQQAPVATPGINPAEPPPQMPPNGMPEGMTTQPSPAETFPAQMPKELMMYQLLNMQQPRQPGQQGPLMAPGTESAHARRMAQHRQGMGLPTPYPSRMGGGMAELMNSWSGSQ